MPEQKRTLVHGSAVVISAQDKPAAVLLRGFSGAGKSDLAFRLIESGKAQLLSDDQVELERRHDKITTIAAQPIKGLLEVRGLGLLRYAAAPPAPLALVVDLVAREAMPRLPERETADILGVAIPLLRLHAFDASTPFKIVKAIELAQNPALLV